MVTFTHTTPKTLLTLAGNSFPAELAAKLKQLCKDNRKRQVLVGLGLETLALGEGRRAYLMLDGELCQFDTASAYGDGKSIKGINTPMPLTGMHWIVTEDRSRDIVVYQVSANDDLALAAY